MLNLCDNGHQAISFSGYEKCPLCIALSEDKSEATKLQNKLDHLESEFDEYKKKVEATLEAATSVNKLVSELKEISG